MRHTKEIFERLTLTILLSILFTVALAGPAHAKLKIVGTTADIAALAKVVGGDNAQVSSIAKGSQDPHYVEAKPSYMIVVRDADLLVANGLSLEVGWLPSLIRGARNPKLNPGSRNYIELGSLIQPIEVPQGQITRAMGDVHPDGNPHFTLDPIRDGDLAVKLAERMGELDAANKEVYMKRATDFQSKMKTKTTEWTERIKKSGVTEIVTYHPSLNYFIDRFGLKAPIFLENKPGIPPTAQHTLDVIETMKTKKIKLILVDNFFDTKIADRIAKDVPGAKVISIGNSVDSAPGLSTLEDVTEQLVHAIESVK